MDSIDFGTLIIPPPSKTASNKSNDPLQFPTLTHYFNVSQTGSHELPIEVIYDRNVFILTPSVATIFASDVNFADNAEQFKIEFNPRTPIKIDTHILIRATNHAMKKYPNLLAEDVQKKIKITANVIDHVLELTSPETGLSLLGADLDFGQVFFGQQTDIASIVSNKGPFEVRWVSLSFFE